MNELVMEIINAGFVFAAAAVPIYLCFRLEGYLKLLTGILGGFVIVHGLYHSLEVFGYEELAESLLEPLSVALLILFGVMFWKIRKKKEVVVPQ